MRFSFSNLLQVATCALLFASCVTQKQYGELAEVRDYYKSEAEAVDSISIANQELIDKNRELELLLKQTTRELEEIAVANESLIRNNEEILAKYNRLISQRSNDSITRYYEKLSLQSQLSAQQEALEKQENEVALMEYELYKKETQLGNIQYDYNASLSEREEQIRQLRQMLQAKDASMEKLRASIRETLMGFSDTDLTVTEKDGRIYLSLSQELLFASGSDRVDREGQSALQKVAAVIVNNKDVDITVEGHTDADGSAATNWDLSVNRATSVVKLLTRYGVDPTRLTAAGKGEYAPVASNRTNRGKALNRRTEIILSPKLDELYSIMNQQNKS